MEAVEAFAATVTDPVRKQQLLDAVKRLKDISPQCILQLFYVLLFTVHSLNRGVVMEAIKYVLENPNDPAGHARLKTLIDQTKLASAHLAQIAQLTPQEETVWEFLVLQIFTYVLTLYQEAKLRAEEVKRKKLSAQAAAVEQLQPALQRVKIGMKTGPCVALPYYNHTN